MKFEGSIVLMMECHRMSRDKARGVMQEVLQVGISEEAI